MPSIGDVLDIAYSPTNFDYIVKVVVKPKSVEQRDDNAAYWEFTIRPPDDV